MFPCHFASLSHKIFAFQLEMLLDGATGAEPHPAAADDPRACDLGKWIVAHNQEMAHLPHFRDLEASHVRFHEIAGDMMNRLRGGDLTGARSIAESGFKEASAAVLAAIEAMGDEMTR